MAAMASQTVKANYPKCAFCKYWYDPANSYISPKSPVMDIWSYDTDAKCKCLKKNLNMPSGGGGGCKYYECKIMLNRK